MRIRQQAIPGAATISISIMASSASGEPAKNIGGPNAPGPASDACCRNFFLLYLPAHGPGRAT